MRSGGVQDSYLGINYQFKLSAELAEFGCFDDAIFVYVSFSEWRRLQGDLKTSQVAIKFGKLET
jgi:hypothetical protein